jgi:alpha-tubulin suppressor-like RCC1 family protein
MKDIENSKKESPLLGLTGMGGGVGGFNFLSGASATPFRIFAWGYNAWGQLGINQTENSKSSPTQVGTDTDWSIGLASNSGYWAFFLKNDGTMWGSGRGLNGSSGMGFGDGPETSSPTQLPGKYTSFAVNRSVAATRGDGSLWTWGQNSYGELGLNSTTNYSSPKQVGTDTTWGSSDSDLTKEGGSFKTLAGGQYYKMFLKTNGTLWACGRNSDDMNLGLNDQAHRSSPTQVGTDTTWKAISGRGHTMAALKTNGTVWAWGRNGYGQAGQNNEIWYSSPAQIGTETTWAEIDSHSSRMGGIKTDGTLWMWGNNTRGSLGHNEPASNNKSSPKQVGTNTNWSTISVGAACFATKTDGTAWAWGTNDEGVLGLNSGGTYHTSISSPAQLPGTDWQRIHIGSSSIFGLKTVD